MAIDDLPLPVVNFLNVIGVPWPYVDEDQLVEFARLTRAFATAVRVTHDDATRAVSGIAIAYQGSATDAMTAGWARMSARHVDVVVDACHVLADAVEMAAGYIVAQKAEAIAVLAGLAAAFVADQAAAVATAGLAEAAVPLLIEAAEKLVRSLVMDLEQHIVGRVMEAAAEPLFAEVEQMLAGMDWSRTGSVRVEPAAAVSLDRQALAQYASLLRGHAETMEAHGDRYADAVLALDL